MGFERVPPLTFSVFSGSPPGMAFPRPAIKPSQGFAMGSLPTAALRFGENSTPDSQDGLPGGFPRIIPEMTGETPKLWQRVKSAWTGYRKVYYRFVSPIPQIEHQILGYLERQAKTEFANGQLHTGLQKLEERMVHQLLAFPKQPAEAYLQVGAVLRQLAEDQQLIAQGCEEDVLREIGVTARESRAEEALEQPESRHYRTPSYWQAMKNADLDFSILSQKAYGQALQYLPSVAVLAENADGLAERAKIHLKAGQVASGVVLLEQAATFDSRHRPTLARLKATLGSVDEAITLYQQSLAPQPKPEEEPEQAAIRYALGELLERTHRSEEALEQFEAAATLQPDNDLYGRKLNQFRF